MKSARLGAVGARPNAFNTTRYSEKLLQAFGISVSCIDLSEVFGRAEKINDQDNSVKERLESIRAYVPTSGIHNYGDDPNKCVVFHCGNWAKSFLGEVKMANAEILATTLGTENTYGTVAGRTPKGPFSYSRSPRTTVMGSFDPTSAMGNLWMIRWTISAAGQWWRSRTCKD
jgi:L-fucose isomerase-like protein